MLREVREDGSVLTYYYDTAGICGFSKRTYVTDEDGNTSYTDAYYFYHKNLQSDVTAILDQNGNVVAEYLYDAWGKCYITYDPTGIGAINPIRYRSYYYDTETGLYYLNSRYYDPNTGRFINADSPENLGADGSILSYNLYAYCIGNPSNRVDSEGEWSMPNWAKVVVGAVTTVAAVAVTVATGGAALPVIAGVVASTAVSGAIGYATGGTQGMVDGLADGFMMGGIGALGGAVIGGASRTIKNAKSGITIGKKGTFEDVAALANTRHYSGLTEFNLIKKVAGEKAAETVGWWQNKCVVKAVMALKGAIYDCGGELTGSYAKEIALTKGYQYLYNIWLM
ncbi:MAG: RHS repeat-associated core domain-containing protein [Clostridia bacterium]|nr:RHS repeat-associated core domain-containing protein [Clostridia bacterium]